MYKETVPSKLQAARKAAGLTQTEVAEILNVKQPVISQWENGTREPGIEMLGRLIVLYNISAEWLLGTGGEKKPYKLEKI